MPAPAKAKPTTVEAGMARIASGELTSGVPKMPSAAITATKPMTYSPPRIRAHVISPRATSLSDIGVAMTASYSLAYLSL